MTTVSVIICTRNRAAQLERAARARSRRRDVLDAVGGFDERFGPRPTSAIGGEESQVGRLVERTGRGELAYRVGAVGGHRVPRLGNIAACALRLGLDSVRVTGGGRITIRPEHGRGFVEQPGSGQMAAGW